MNHLGDTNKKADETVSFCPHCRSGNDPVLKDTTWSCGVRFNDSTWRTKECFKRNLESANDRIKRLEEALYKIEFYAATGILQDSFDEIKRIAKEVKL